MSKRTSAVLGIPALVVLLAMSAGCATTKQLNEVRATADEAKAMASDAMSRADAAMSRADEANQRAAATDQKIDEMFKKAMMK